jgi:hypothetical protein
MASCFNCTSCLLVALLLYYIHLILQGAAPYGFLFQRSTPLRSYVVVYVLYISTFIYIHVYVYKYLYIHTCICINMYACIYVWCMYVYIYLYIYRHAYIHICVCVCIYIKYIYYCNCVFIPIYFEVQGLFVLILVYKLLENRTTSVWGLQVLVYEAVS